MEKQKIIAKIYAPDENGTLLCNINIDGRSALVPFTQLNFSMINLCAEYKCIREMKIREMNYPINITPF